MTEQVFWMYPVRSIIQDCKNTAKITEDFYYVGDWSQ